MSNMLLAFESYKQKQLNNQLYYTNEMLKQLLPTQLIERAFALMLSGDAWQRQDECDKAAALFEEGFDILRNFNRYVPERLGLMIFWSIEIYGDYLLA